MAKAIRLLGTIEPVTKYTRLISPGDAERIIAAVDDRCRPATRDQAATLVAELIGAYPELANLRKSDGRSKDFQLYSVKLFEAFSRFSFEVGKAIVNGGTGVPARQRYRPQPSDVVEFGEKELERLRTVKVMAQRHIEEAARRDAERREERRYPSDPVERERMRDRVARLVQGMPRL